MTNNVKSVVLLAFTLIVGFAFGLFADATLVRNRRERIQRLGRPPGVMAHLEEVIQPHSPAQADSIRPALQALAAGNEEVIRNANLRLRARMDSLRTTLAPMLDSGQRERLTRELNRVPPVGIGRGGLGGRGRGRGGPPGDGGGPPGGPPPGGGPPPT
jgi:hypothetical protein